MRADACAQAMDADGFVLFHRHFTEQRRQLAGGRAPQQVHFEITLLRVHIAECAGRIGIIGGRDGDRAVAIAGDLHRL